MPKRHILEDRFMVMAEGISQKQSPVARLLAKFKNTIATNDVLRSGRPRETLPGEGCLVLHVRLTSCQLTSSLDMWMVRLRLEMITKKKATIYKLLKDVYLLIGIWEGALILNC